MHFSTLLFPLLALILDHTADAIDNNPGGVYMCSGPNFAGTCTRQNTPGMCIHVMPGHSSIGPDKWFACTLFDNGSCEENGPQHKFVLKHPGTVDMKAELRKKGAGFDEAKSMKCRYTGPTPKWLPVGAPIGQE
ncbi:MAG: hypothetical protein Q9227_000629 [Pyrenula ochraceoflavens]